MRREGFQFASELDTRRRLLQELGVPVEAIITLDPPVDSTMSEAEAVATWARLGGVRSLTIVTSRLHTRRAKLVYRHLLEAVGITVRMRAVSDDTYAPETWWTSRRGLRDGLLEWEKLVFYRLRY